MDSDRRKFVTYQRNRAVTSRHKGPIGNEVFLQGVDSLLIEMQGTTPKVGLPISHRKNLFERFLR